MERYDEQEELVNFRLTLGLVPRYFSLPYLRFKTCPICHLGQPQGAPFSKILRQNLKSKAQVSSDWSRVITTLSSHNAYCVCHTPPRSFSEDLQPFKLQVLD